MYLLIIALFVSLMSYGQGYEIKVKINGLKNQDIILGHQKNDNLVPDDTIKTDNKGYAVFKGKKPLKQGMYFIFLPSRNYFEFILGKDQTFSIETDTINFIEKMKVKGSEENILFADYRIFMVKENKKVAELRKQYDSETDETKKKEIENDLRLIGDKFKKRYDEIITQYPDMFFSTFLKATKGVDIPKTITDRQQQYYYYKYHYFDNFDLSDSRLLYTPFYENKIDVYLDKVVQPDPDSINAALDMMLAKTEHDKDLYQYMLLHLFNKYATSQLMIAENMYVHLGEIYAKTAVWSTDSFKNELKTKIVRKKNCLIGNNALDMDLYILPSDSIAIEELKIPLADMKQKGLVIEKDKSRSFEDKIPDLSQLIGEYLAFFPSNAKLSDVQAKYTILWFMSPSCSHCITETPLFYKDYQTKLKSKGVVVWSIFLESNTDNWSKFSGDFSTWYDFIQKNELYEKGWYNMLNPFDNFRFKYDISSSPILYLLDKDKKILAKKIGYQQAIEIIEDIEKNGL